MFFYLSFIAIVSGVSLILSGRGEVVSGLVAIFVGLVALGMGVRQHVVAANRPRPWPVAEPTELVVRIPSPPYTEADFPFPGAAPGGVVCPPGLWPVPFAVITPGPRSADEYREIGRRLTAFRDATPDGEIFGLDQMTNGLPPRTPSWMLYLASRRETERFEGVALVRVPQPAANDATFAELSAALSGSPINQLMRFEVYDAMTR